MSHTEIVAILIQFLNKEILEDQAEDLDAEARILELGILDSLSMVQFLAFVDDTFSVKIPEADIVPEHFSTVSTVAKLIVSLQYQARVAQQRSKELQKIARIQESYGVLSEIFVPDGQNLELHSLKVEGDRPTWVMLPGGNSSTSWAPMMRLLRGTQASVAVDLAGFGLSVYSTDAPGYRDHVSHMTQFVDALEGPIVLLANSVGTMIATDLVRARRDRIKALVVSGFGLIDDIDGWWTKVQTFLGDPRLFLDANYHKPPRLTPALKRLLEDILARPAYTSFLDDDARTRMPQCFDDLGVPVLYVMGANDDIIPRQSVDNAVARIPGVRLEWMTQCGHFPYAERSEQFIELVRNFLQTAGN